MANTQSTTPTIKGELRYEDRVLQKIVGIALAKIDGVLTIDGGFFSNIAEKLVNTSDVTTGIDVEVGQKQVAVDLDIVAAYGIEIAALYQQMKDAIQKQVKHMTGLDVIEVNVTVVDVKTKAEYEKDAVTLQDRVGNVADKTKEAVSKGSDRVSAGMEKLTPDQEPVRVD
ncbi:Asp23/Gls24 family envelope stress response protein [Loigolactobacillus bifermentans]|uniref:Stress response regulator gls24 homolog n=1 Tax=Loigolactobacillus bifermentans DSM 20003 TaxID=1423726 RepID=A0A0R1H666_9LACO|nr:Asp23/Gls24 family envelope stress response protein [Loigolactobacillus bifermentans]KRK39106.1 general stress protein gls20 [Loigolactobacillus bifermentans DSM 20003]QGG59007.1 Asp23/Gls24 family envelope stress response protein [Loigolactobacillus bifermentans]